MKERNMLYMAVPSILLYGAPVWQRALKIQKYKNIMKSTQRVCGAFRTVSYDTAMVTAGMARIHILAEERKGPYKNSITDTTDRLEARQITLIK